MTRDELFARLLEETSKRWHWWSFHFQVTAKGGQVPFVVALLETVLAVDAAMPGYAERFASDIGSIGGRDRHRPDYEQPLERLAELHVVRHLVLAHWPPGSTFADEPVAPGSARNPEVVISSPAFRVGVEVKAPALLDHEARRSTFPVQASGRVFSLEQMMEIAGGTDRLTLPRDNPVKDFLASADQKFASFSATDPDFFSVLAIVWDDFIYEPSPRSPTPRRDC